MKNNTRSFNQSGGITANNVYVANSKNLANSTVAKEATSNPIFKMIGSIFKFIKGWF